MVVVVIVHLICSCLVYRVVRHGVTTHCERGVATCVFRSEDSAHRDTLNSKPRQPQQTHVLTSRSTTAILSYVTFTIRYLQLGSAALVAEVSMPGSGHKVVKCTGVPNPGRTTTVLVRGSNRCA